jgi:thiol-disulfide isomerase/thioredoxin
MLLILLSITLVGCAEKLEKSEEKAITVYFYYRPDCPACQKVKPYMNMISQTEGVGFDFCNLAIMNCSSDSINILRKVELRYIPSAVVKVQNKMHILVGTNDVLKLGELLEEYGARTPEVMYKNASYSIVECIRCHEEENIAPPTTFSCTPCCHDECER